MTAPPPPPRPERDPGVLMAAHIVVIRDVVAILVLAGGIIALSVALGGFTFSNSAM